MSDAGLVPGDAILPALGTSPAPSCIPTVSPVGFWGMPLPMLPVGCPSPLLPCGIALWGDAETAQRVSCWTSANHETMPRPDRRNEGREQHSDTWPCLRGETLWNKRRLKNQAANAPKKAMSQHHAWLVPGLLGKGGGNAVWVLSWLNCEQEMGHLWVETEIFEALRCWPRESLGCSDSPAIFL